MLQSVYVVVLVLGPCVCSLVFQASATDACEMNPGSYSEHLTETSYRFINSESAQSSLLFHKTLTLRVALGFDKLHAS